LRDGLEEMFTVNRLGLLPSLMRCFRKIQDDRDLWMPKAVWNPTLEVNQVNSMEQVA
jgi:hypothetical protein